MIFDIIVAIFIVITMTSGYVAGGFREILKIISFAGIFVIFNVPSFKNALLSFSGTGNYTAYYIISFLVLYIVLYQVLFFSMKGLVVEKEGVTGEINKTLGITFGFFRGIMILVVAVFIFEALQKKNIFIEFKSFADDSLFYSVVKKGLDNIGLGVLK